MDDIGLAGDPKLFLMSLAGKGEGLTNQSPLRLSLRIYCGDNFIENNLFSAVDSHNFEVISEPHILLQSPNFDCKKFRSRQNSVQLFLLYLHFFRSKFGDFVTKEDYEMTSWYFKMTTKATNRRFFLF